MVVEFLYKEVMSAKVAETTKGETYKQQQITLFLFFLPFSPSYLNFQIKFEILI